MKLNSTLEKKLLKYSAMAGGVMAMGSVANAQITYFDEDPDVEITGHQMGLVWDFDGDGNDDISLYTLDGSQTGVTSSGTYNYTLAYKIGGVYAYSGAGAMEGTSQLVLNLNGTFPFTPTNATNTFGDKLNAGDAINSLGAWGSSADAMSFAQNFRTDFTPPINSSINFVTWQNSWVGAADKYLGIRFSSNGNQHYGWMRVDVNADATILTVKDWAFNTLPDESINAGQMTVGIADQAGELALVRFVNNRLDVKAVNGTSGNVSVVNMEGKVVYNSAMNNEDLSVDLSSFAAGIYVVNAAFTEGGVQHKIVIR